MNEKSIYYRVKYVCSNPSTQTIVKGSEICVYIYRYHDSLSGYKSDKDMYHCVFTRSDLYLAAEHVQEVIAHIVCSCPLEFVVESRAVL